MFRLRRLAVYFAMTSCVTPHIGDVGTIAGQNVEFSCNESGELDNEVTAITCLFVNQGAPTTFKVFSAMVKNRSDSFLPLTPEQTEMAVRNYKAKNPGTMDSSAIAFSWVGLVAMASGGAKSSGAAGAGVGMGMASSIALSGKNKSMKIKKLEVNYGEEHLLGAEVKLKENGQLKKTALFAYDLKQAGARKIVLCIGEGSTACKEAELNRVAEMRKRS